MTSQIAHDTSLELRPGDALLYDFQDGDWFVCRNGLRINFDIETGRRLRQWLPPALNAYQIATLFMLIAQVTGFSLEDRGDLYHQFPHCFIKGFVAVRTSDPSSQAS